MANITLESELELSESLLDMEFGEIFIDILGVLLVLAIGCIVTIVLTMGTKTLCVECGVPFFVSQMSSMFICLIFSLIAFYWAFAALKLDMFAMAIAFGFSGAAVFAIVFQQMGSAVGILASGAKEGSHVVIGNVQYKVLSIGWFITVLEYRPTGETSRWKIMQSSAFYASTYDLLPPI
jgi:hypothetical protein